MLAMSDRIFRRGDLFERATQVQADRTPAFVRAPWNRLRESEVDLERARARLKSLHCSTDFWLELVTCQCKQLTRRNVAEGESAIAEQIAECCRVDAVGSVKRSTQLLKMGDQVHG